VLLLYCWIVVDILLLCSIGVLLLLYCCVVVDILLLCCCCYAIVVVTLMCVFSKRRSSTWNFNRDRDVVLRPGKICVGIFS